MHHQGGLRSFRIPTEDCTCPDTGLGHGRHRLSELPGWVEYREETRVINQGPNPSDTEDACCQQQQHRHTGSSHHQAVRERQVLQIDCLCHQRHQQAVHQQGNVHRPRDHT